MSNGTSEVIESGPIDYLVIEMPENRVTGKGMSMLIDLVDRGIIRILDLTLVSKDKDGTVRAVELADLDGDGELDATLFEGVSSGLLGQEDISEAGTILEPGNCAAVLLYENLWAAPLATTLRRSGARMIASGRVPLQDIIETLEALEAAS